MSGDAALGVQIGVALVLFGVGLLAGLWLRRRNDRGLRAQVAGLEEELGQARGELDGFHAEVEKHFGQTSDLFRDLTRQYTALYAHLAEGARELCPERVPELGRGLAGPLLAAAEPASESPADEPPAGEPPADEPPPPGSRTGE
jgi:uncharacterized membrane-anchored protein YhcB (DUF1043 family)